MKILTIVLLFTFSLSSFAFFDFFKSKPKIRPIDLPTEEARMSYLKEHDPNFYAQIVAAQDGIVENGNTALSNMQDRFDEDWKRYTDSVDRRQSPEEVERQLVQERQRREADLQRQIQQKEREVLDQYKVVNGQLVNRAEEIKLIKSQEDEIKLRKAVQQFQREEGLKVISDDQKINLKE